MNSYETIKSKIEHFCAYQERCESDVRKKLYKLGANNDLVELIMDDLREDKFINEQRFCDIYVIGKLRNNKWGFQKISHSLKQKGLDDKLIYKSLQNIDNQEYKLICKDVISKNCHRSKFNLKQYLFSRGFELSLIDELINL